MLNTELIRSTGRDFPEMLSYRQGRIVKIPLIGAERQVRSITGYVIAASLCLGTTAYGGTISIQQPIVGAKFFGAGYSAREEEIESVPTMLSELRRRAALTWEHLAILFNVSRRSVHNWAAGSTIAPQNVAKIQDLVTRVRRLDEGRPFALRAKLGLASSPSASSQVRSAGSDRSPILYADQSPMNIDPPRSVGRIKMRPAKI